MNFKAKRIANKAENATVSDIDFWIVGAQKSATTTLYDLLADMSGVNMPEVKELLWYTKREAYNKKATLNDFYSAPHNLGLKGAADVNICFDRKAQKLLREHNPQVKLIFLLRDPVMRAYSAYQFARSNGLEESDDFIDAIKKDQENQPLTYNDWAGKKYIDHSLYGEQLEALINQFGRQNILVIFQSELINKTSDTVNKVRRFIGLDDLPHVPALPRSNPARQPKIKSLQKWLWKDSSLIKSIYKKILPQRIKVWMRKKIINPVIRLNSDTKKTQTISDNEYHVAKSFFVEDEKKLKALLGIHLPWDK